MGPKVSFLVLYSVIALFSVNYAFDSNWFTKSMDYFTLKNCSSLKQSMIIGDFRECLESPIKREPRSIFWPWNRRETEETTVAPTTETSSPTDESIATLDDSTTADGILNSTETSTASSKDWEASHPNGFAWNQWPKTTCNELKNINKCIGQLLEIDCLLENEVEFFNTTKNMFENQEQYVCERADDIYEEFKNSSCKNKVNMDVNTICYSWNQNKYDWMNWNLNFSDGQMCSYLFDLKNCELESYKKCSENITEFVEGYWEAALNATPCSSPPLSDLDTKNGGLDVDGWSKKGANFYKKFFDRTKGGITNFTHTGEKFGEKDTDTPLRGSHRGYNYLDNPFLDIAEFYRRQNYHRRHRKINQEIINNDIQDNDTEIEVDISTTEETSDDGDDDDDDDEDNSGHNDYFFDFEGKFKRKVNEKSRPEECRGYNVRRCLRLLDFSRDICRSTGRFLDCMNSKIAECDSFFYPWELNAYRGMKRTYGRINFEVCNQPKATGDADQCLDLRAFLRCAAEKQENREIIREVLELND